MQSNQGTIEGSFGRIECPAFNADSSDLSIRKITMSMLNS